MRAGVGIRGSLDRRPRLWPWPARSAWARRTLLWPTARSSACRSPARRPHCRPRAARPGRDGVAGPAGAQAGQGLGVQPRLRAGRRRVPGDQPPGDGSGGRDAPPLADALAGLRQHRARTPVPAEVLNANPGGAGVGAGLRSTTTPTWTSRRATSRPVIIVDSRAHCGRADCTAAPTRSIGCSTAKSARPTGRRPALPGARVLPAVADLGRGRDARAIRWPSSRVRTSPTTSGASGGTARRPRSRRDRRRHPVRVHRGRALRRQPDGPRRWPCPTAPTRARSSRGRRLLQRVLLPSLSGQCDHVWRRVSVGQAVQGSASSAYRGRRHDADLGDRDGWSIPSDVRPAFNAYWAEPVRRRLAAPLQPPCRTMDAMSAAVIVPHPARRAERAQPPDR